MRPRGGQAGQGPQLRKRHADAAVQGVHTRPRLGHGRPTACAPDKTGALKIITYVTTIQTEQPKDITEDDQEKLLKETVLIKDDRDSQDTSIAYNTQVEQKLFNPGNPGLYEVLVKPGEFEKCFIAYQPVGQNGRAEFCTVVRTSR